MPGCIHGVRIVHGKYYHAVGNGTGSRAAGVRRIGLDETATSAIIGIRGPGRIPPVAAGRVGAISCRPRVFSFRFDPQPETGGSQKGYRSFHEPVLDDAELDALKAFAEKTRTILPGVPGIDSPGPFDVELGFKGGKLWLFQVRPYVENRRAKASEYLRSLDSDIPSNAVIELDKEI